MSNRIQFSEKQTQNIIRLYTIENLSIDKISQIYNVGPRIISRVLKENNIKTKSNDFYCQKYCDETFFDVIDTEDKAYWLGFIYADGCISSRKVADVFEIKLSINDKMHLEKLKSSLQSEHCIGTYISSCGYNKGKSYCSLSIVNQHLVDGLMKNGVTYRKTHSLQFPSENQVAKCLIPHFIRGYFDGDGSIYCLKDTGLGGMSFTGSKDMLNGILREIQNIIPTKTQVYKYPDKDVYDLKIGGSNYLEKCYHYLYDDATIFLDRKKHKFEDIIIKTSM